MSASQINNLAAGIRALFATRPTRPDGTPNTDPLFMIVTEAPVKPGSPAVFVKYMLGNGLTTVALDGWWQFYNIETGWVKSTDMSKVKKDRADQGVSLAVTNEEIAAGLTDPKPIPSWLEEILMKNRAIRGQTPCPLPASVQDVYGQIMKESKFERNDTIDMFFILKTINESLMWLLENSEAIYKDEAHPCNSKAWNNYVSPTTGKYLLNLTDRDTDRVKGSYKTYYTKTHPPIAGHKAVTEKIFYKTPRVEMFFKWSKQEQEFTPRKINKPDADAKLYHWHGGQEGVFRMPERYNFGKSKIPVSIGRPFDESTLALYLPRTSLIRGSVTFDFSVTATCISFKPHIHNMDIHHGIGNGGNSTAGESGFSEEAGPSSSMSFGSSFTDALPSAGPGSTSVAPLRADPEEAQEVFHDD